ncbi:hypothetical protein [Lutibacter sp.]|uniref:XAC2610-related protein n=1 Tax=Lutibacter sp. TaxID=1925666 RepID=UPI0027354036|nr:hypothetical protein [Lutibacter sp.]MDP3314073.1 hypothetical protein [Lutibacter sp.]
MKKAQLLLIFFISTVVYSQGFTGANWFVYPHKTVPFFTITKTEVLKFQNLTFNVKWDGKLSYSENLGYNYGGIGELKIYYKNRLLQTINNIEDETALGTIYLYLYDFNMDGFLDFSIRSECGKSCYYQYYLYNSFKNQFQHQVEWDSIRISQLNKKTKQLLTEPEGTATEGQSYIYKIEDHKLTLLKVIPYGLHN